MKLLQKLKHIFNCESYVEICKILGIRVEITYLWKNKNKIPPHYNGLFKLIYKQQEEIIKLKNKIVEFDSEEGN